MCSSPLYFEPVMLRLRYSFIYIVPHEILFQACIPQKCNVMLYFIIAPTAEYPVDKNAGVERIGVTRLWRQTFWA